MHFNKFQWLSNISSALGCWDSLKFYLLLLDLCNLQKKVLTVFDGAQTGFQGDQTGYCEVHGRMASPPHPMLGVLLITIVSPRFYFSFDFSEKSCV